MNFGRKYQQLKNIYHFFQAWAWRVWYGMPDTGMKLYGVTGTNGKTTTSILLGSILRAAYGKEEVGLLSTIVFWIGDKESVNETKMTTLSSRQMFEYLRRMRRQGVTQAVLEISSHALDQYRLAGMRLEGAIITNVQREHLDYHETMEEYAKAKGKIVGYVKAGGVVVGKEDDELVRGILRKAQLAKHKTQTLGFTADEARRVQTPLAGDFNQENVLAAMKLARGVGISEDAITAGVQAVKSVPGRMEWVVSTGKPRVLIDYAVTPDALEGLYKYVRGALRPPGKIYAILGAAGLRDRGKRPDMARAVAQYADEVILTREDPWTESEEQIFQDLEQGLREVKIPWRRIVDRRAALEYAMNKAQAEDVIVLTGKGAELGMGIGKKIVPWNERQIVKELLGL